jgi:Protein of unknown function (DUF2637)
MPPHSPTTASEAALAPLTVSQRWLAAATGLASTALAVLGGIGSFAAVAEVAARHGFDHPGRVPLTVDVGIVGLILADFLLAWLRMPFPPLRWLAWLLTGTTVWFNMAAAWGDPIGMAMHAAAPALWVTWVEGMRHATRVRTRMAQRRHVERSPLGRWLLAPMATFRMWRYQQLWNVTSYQEALELEQRRLEIKADLQERYGWTMYGLFWRLRAPLRARYALRVGLERRQPARPGVSPTGRPAISAATQPRAEHTPPASPPASTARNRRRSKARDAVAEVRARLLAEGVITAETPTLKQAELIREHGRLPQKVRTIETYVGAQRRAERRAEAAGRLPIQPSPRVLEPVRDTHSDQSSVA